MKKILLLIAIVSGLSANAQMPDSTRKTFAPVDIYHGIGLGYNVGFSAADVSYFLDLHMRKRLYLFTRHAINIMSFIDEPRDWEYGLYSTVSFAFRLNGEDKKWQYFPYIGSGLVLGRYYTDNSYSGNSYQRQRIFETGFFPIINFGVEVKCKLKNNRHIGFGINVSSYPGPVAFFNYGWNRAYKHK